MKRISHNLAWKEMDDLNCEVQRFAEGLKNTPPSPENFNFETTVRTTLRLIKSPKEWGQELQVSQQQVNRWINGSPIPVLRMFQIARRAKGYFLQQRQIEDEIDLALLLQYGGRDPGRF